LIRGDICPKIAPVSPITTTCFFPSYTGVSGLIFQGDKEL